MYLHCLCIYVVYIFSLHLYLNCIPLYMYFNCIHTHIVHVVTLYAYLQHVLILLFCTNMYLICIPLVISFLNYHHHNTYYNHTYYHSYINTIFNIIIIIYKLQLQNMIDAESFDVLRILLTFGADCRLKDKDGNNGEYYFMVYLIILYFSSHSPLFLFPFLSVSHQYIAFYSSLFPSNI